MTILIIDDNKTNLILLTSLAEQASGMTTISMEDPVEALYWCEQNVPALVLVDYRMPSLSGTDFIRLFRQMDGMADVPIVMVTTENERSVRQEALGVGATDFLAKPVDTIEFRLRVRNLLALGQARELLADRARLLQHEVAAATADIAARERELVMRLARAAEYRDPETGAHILRMARYSALIARKLGLPAEFEAMLLEAAPMHDVGKLATPDAILLKPGRLTEAEMTIMRRHAPIGARILGGSSSPLIQLAEEIAGAHHEKFDGSGYPKGLSGKQIPMSAQFTAISDVYDALRSKRPYKEPWTHGETVKLILSNSASHFDPDYVQVFAKLQDRFEAVYQELMD